MIVSIASLAWTIYNDRRTRSHEPPTPETIARQVRITLREQDTVLPPSTGRITEIIATEITRHGRTPAFLRSPPLARHAAPAAVRVSQRRDPDLQTAATCGQARPDRDPD